MLICFLLLVAWHLLLEAMHLLLIALLLLLVRHLLLHAKCLCRLPVVHADGCWLLSPFTGRSQSARFWHSLVRFGRGTREDEECRGYRSESIRSMTNMSSCFESILMIVFFGWRPLLLGPRLEAIPLRVVSNPTWL